MALAPFFDRVYTAAGRHLSVTREALEQKLATVVVGVKYESGSGPNDRWIAEMVVNQLSRLYPQLYIRADASESKRLIDLAQTINPSITFVNDAPNETTVVIGLTGEPGTVHARATGWVASIGREGIGQSGGPDNALAAGAAASLAVAEIFRRVFLGRFANEPFSLSLLDYGIELGRDLPMDAVALPTTALLGLGAVGNAAVWALARCRGLSGKLYLVDKETLETSNLQRYVLGTLDAVGEPKVNIAARELRSTAFDVHPRTMTLEEFAEGVGDQLQLPTACVSVDNISGRRAAQALLPRLAINGWTGDSALGASWHLFDREAACLACLYQPSREGRSQTDLVADALGLEPQRATLLWVTRQPLTDDELKVAAERLGLGFDVLQPWRGKPIGDLYTDVVCGAVPLDLRGIGKLETVPLAHQSALAGVLMAAELIKRASSTLAAQSQEEPLVTWDDVLRAPPQRWTRPRPRERGCICTDPVYQEIYRQKWGDDPLKPRL